MIENGFWKSDEEKNEYEIYSNKVWKITYIQIKKFGSDYLKEINKKEYNKNIKKFKDFWSIDHKYSIKQGFLNKIDPQIIGSIINLEIIKLYENSIKHSKCSIELDKLISEYNLFYKNII